MNEKAKEEEKKQISFDYSISFDFSDIKKWEIIELINELLFIFHSIEFVNLMEKKLTLTNIRAQFTKDFDTFGKMVILFLSRTPTCNLKLAKV